MYKSPKKSQQIDYIFRVEHGRNMTGIIAIVRKAREAAMEMGFDEDTAWWQSQLKMRWTD